MAEWLSVWHAEARARNDDLHEVQGIHVPHGKGRIAVGHLIYCTCIEDKEPHCLRCPTSDERGLPISFR